MTQPISEYDDTIELHRAAWAYGLYVAGFETALAELGRVLDELRDERLDNADDLPYTDSAPE